MGYAGGTAWLHLPCNMEFLENNLYFVQFLIFFQKYHNPLCFHPPRHFSATPLLGRKKKDDAEAPPCVNDIQNYRE